MNIIAIADDESLVGALDAQADLLISLGDLYDGTIRRAVGCYKPQRTFAVRGNHDTAGPFLEEVEDLHLTVKTMEGLRFGGFAGCWRYKPRGHHLFDHEEVAAALLDFPPVDVFVAHNSPFGIHQRDSDVHQGFHAFTDYIARAQPRWFLHGHQHVNSVTRVGGTTVIGVFGERLIKLS